MRTTKPEKNNKYYITKSKGGYNTAIEGKCSTTGKPDCDCNVLANCVGYAVGRFNEIIGKGNCDYLKPVAAEQMINDVGTLKTGKVPKVGAVMVWSKGSRRTTADGCGHVAIVEEVVDSEEVYTSESGWNSTPFWNQTRKKGNGNWGQNSSYTFLGFIYNPAVNSKTINTISVDGIFGAQTIRYTQKMFNGKEDGIISNQHSSNKKYLKSVNIACWQFNNKKGGSTVVKNIQKLVGAEVDGLLGKATITCMQQFLKKNSYYSGPLSGNLDKITTKAWQSYVNNYFERTN